MIGNASNFCTFFDWIAKTTIVFIILGNFVDEDWPALLKSSYQAFQGQNQTQGAAEDGQVWAKLGPAVLKTCFKSVATPLCLEKFKPVNFLTNCLTVDVKKIWASCL